MEQFTMFVLGIGVGSLAIMLISSFLGMLKIRKQIEQLQKQNQAINDETENIKRDIDERFRENQTTIERSWQEIGQELNKINRELTSLISDIEKAIYHRIDNTEEEERRIRHEDFNTVMKRIDELNRYTDSRFDKVIDTLCTRMDTMFVQKETDTTILKS